MEGVQIVWTVLVVWFFVLCMVMMGLVVRVARQACDVLELAALILLTARGSPDRADEHYERLYQRLQKVRAYRQRRN